MFRKICFSKMMFIISSFTQSVVAQDSNPTRNAAIQERDALWNKAVQAANDGSLDETLFEEVFEIEKATFGDSDGRLLRTLDVLGQLANFKQDDVALSDVRKRQYEITQRIYGSNNYRSQDAKRAVIEAKENAKRTPDERTRLHQATKLHPQLMNAYRNGDFATAAGLGEQILEIHKGVVDERYPEYTLNLAWLGTLYSALGDYPRAETRLREVAAINERLLGNEHPDYASSLNSLAVLYHETGDYPRAEPLYLKAMMIREKVLGIEHPSYAVSLGNLASIYRSMGDYPRALPLHLKALKIDEQTVGKQHPSYATDLNNLALLYLSMGDHQQAEAAFSESLMIRGESLGKEHPDYATSLSNLAALYDSLGDYARAEPLHCESLAIKEKVLGKGHPACATGLSNLASMYQMMGDITRAELLFREALAIREKTLSKEHPDYARSLEHLAKLCYLKGDYPQAESIYRETLAIREKVLGKEHPDFAANLINLAGLYTAMGDYLRAERLFLDALSIQEKVLGKEHSDYATCLNNLAMLYCSMWEYTQAEQLYLESHAIVEKRFGKDHPHLALNLNSLAVLYETIGDYERAEPRYREAVEISLRNLEKTADVQSQRQQVRMGESLRLQLDAYLSLATREPKFQEEAYGALLRWKGSVWQRQRRQRLLIDQPELKPRFAALQSVSSLLSTLILNPPNPKQLDGWHRQLDELADEREKLERDLSLASAAFREASTPVTPEQLRTSLPERTMLVDFLEYQHFAPANQKEQTKESRERRLLVHLVRAGQEVRAIDLGDVASLNALVQTWRRDLGRSPAAIDAARELRKRIWEPLEQHLGGSTTVFVSPDGLLGQFPLAALPGKRPGSYLIEDLAIVMLPVPQGLPAMASSPSLDLGDDRFCLVGGVDYEQTVAPETPSAPTGSMMLAVRGGEWQAFGPLDGTVTEINEIESLIREHRPATQTTILRGGSATESAFAGVAAGHRFLHVATHGFFAPESVQNAMTASVPDDLMTIGETRSPKLTGQHPDLLSGLVFAGANRKPDSDTENDGILTAAEVQSLDLRKVDLAVLSACETGLGRTAGGEGIIGLQRAFQLAGARTTITSLWKVDDAATQALMVEFYRNLFERKLSKLESLRQAQLWLLNNPDALKGRDLTTRGTVQKLKPLAPDAPTANPTRSLPAYWAAFQLSGDPR